MRAVSIAAGGHVVEFATVDTQGYFAGYQEGPYGISDVRAAVAKYLRMHGDPGASSKDVIISSEHEHAAPTVIGIWGPASHQLPYLKEVAARLYVSVRTVEANLTRVYSKLGIRSRTQLASRLTPGG